MTVAPVVLADETFVISAEMPTLVSSTVPIPDAADPVTSSLCPVASAQSTLFPGFSVVESVTSVAIDASSPVLPELSGMLSSDLALALEPQVGEADAPTSDDERCDGFESQPGGNSLGVL